MRLDRADALARVLDRLGDWQAAARRRRGIGRTVC